MIIIQKINFTLTDLKIFIEPFKNDLFCLMNLKFY